MNLLFTRRLNFFSVLTILFLTACTDNKYNRYNWDYIAETESVEETNKTDKILPVKMVVHYDKGYPTSWVYYPELLVKFLTEKGFTQFNTTETKKWLETRAENKSSTGTVCVLTMGIIPKELVTPQDRSCMLFKYLREGGRIVWVGDSPLMFLGSSGGYSEEFSSNLAWNILGLAGYRKDPETAVPVATITETGKQWGVTLPEKVHNQISSTNVSLVFSDIDPTLCGTWQRNFNTNYPETGFIRYRGTVYDGRDTQQNNDVLRLAIYSLLK